MTPVSLLGNESADQSDWIHRWGLAHYSTSSEITGLSFLGTVVQRETGLGVQITLPGGKEAQEQSLTLRIVNEQGISYSPMQGNPIPFMGGFARGPSDHGQWIYMAEFKWPGNATDAVWIDLQLKGHQFLMELPFGFFRSPEAPLPDLGQSGEVSLPESLREQAAKSTLLPWTLIDYDLGTIQNDWRLSLRMQNGDRPTTELVLYKEDVILGHSKEAWKLEEPSTSIRIQEGTRPPLAAVLLNQRIHNDNMRRSDVYHWPASPNVTRMWVTLLVRVGGREVQRQVPSSIIFPKRPRDLIVQ